MANPHSNTQTMSMFDVDTVLARLPAEARARYEWMKKPIMEGVARLQREPLTPLLIEEVAEGLIDPLTALTSTALRVIVMSLEDLRAAMMEGLRVEQDRLETFVRDEETIDTVRRVFGFLRSLLATNPSVDAVPANDGGPAREGWHSTPILAAYRRAAVAIIAALEEAKAPNDPERARRLVGFAYSSMVRVRNLMRRHGVMLSSAPFETVDERRTKLRADVERLRGVLDEADWQAIEASRVRELR